MLPPEVVRQIRRLQLRARRAVRTLLGGEYHSTFKGAGLSFEEVREYQPGDDVRGIDWNVTARMGQPYIKRYVEERELTLLLVVDLSASQRFGTGAQQKRAVAAELAALLAFSAIGNNDRVGLLAFSDRIERHVTPGKGTRHVLRLLRDLLYYQPEGKGTDLALALDHINKVQKRRTVVFVISDFLGDHESFANSFRRAAHRHDLIAIRTSDPREQSWPAVGLVQLEDAETGKQLLIDTNDSRFRTAFTERATQRQEQLRKLVRGSGADLIEVSTDGQHFDPLLKFFRSRVRRRGRS